MAKAKILKTLPQNTFLFTLLSHYMSGLQKPIHYSTGPPTEQVTHPTPLNLFRDPLQRRENLFRTWKLETVALDYANRASGKGKSRGWWVVGWSGGSGAE